MTICFKILNGLNVVYVKYTGKNDMAKVMQSFAEYVAHPDFRAGQKIFIDLSHVTEAGHDHTEAMKFMAKMTEYFNAERPQTLLVCYAPNLPAQQTALMGLRSWSGNGSLVFRMMADEQAALAFLGLPVESVAGLLAEA